MTSRDRLMAVYNGEMPDRTPIRVWGVDPWTIPRHPSYAPLIEMAKEKTDLVANWGIPLNPFKTNVHDIPTQILEQASEHAEFEERVTIYSTPKGPLKSISLFNRYGKPGFIKKYLIEDFDDVEKFLSVPYRRPRWDISEFFGRVSGMGERGIVMANIFHAMYSINAFTGSETFAVWSIDHRDVLKELLQAMQERCLDHLEFLLENGVGPFFGYVGPELCIPPLQSPRDFHEFVVAYDRDLCDLIHRHGGFVWCHSHGKMGPVLDGFLEMGVDCLNPLEPPPMGDISLHKARRQVGDKMVLEGNIERGDLYLDKPDEIKEKVQMAIAEGGREGRFILCPTAGVLSWPTCDQTTLKNFIAFVDAGLEYGRY